jgi:hypothetical protein
MAAYMAAPGQRRAIEGEHQYCTFRLTRRTVPMTFSMMFETRQTAQTARQANLFYNAHFTKSL